MLLFEVHVKGGYHSGGASYALSQEALRRFYQGHQIHATTVCRVSRRGPEDLEIAKCLRSQHVYAGNSTDEQGRELFHPLSFRPHFIGRIPGWLERYASNPVQSVSYCQLICPFFRIVFSFSITIVAVIEQYRFIICRRRICMNSIFYCIQFESNNRKDIYCKTEQMMNTRIVM